MGEGGGEGNVGGVGEVGESVGVIRGVEVEGKREWEEEGNRDGDVSVGGKVRVYVEGIWVEGKEVLEGGIEGGIMENRL